MSEPIQIRMGGYGPPSTTFSRGLKFVGDRLEKQFGDEVDVKYVWNIMDLGYRGEDIWWLVEHGLLTVGYQSSSALTDRIPELGVADLPFLFESNEEARAAIDGALGAYMAGLMEERVNYRIVGFFENGFRHISNRLRPIRGPADIAGMRIRTLKSRIHERTFEMLGATPARSGLKEAIEAMAAGRVDAQENPLANTVTYGAHKFHHFHTLTRHFYISRPIFVNRTASTHGPQNFRKRSAPQHATPSPISANSRSRRRTSADRPSSTTAANSTSWMLRAARPSWRRSSRSMERRERSLARSRFAPSRRRKRG
jgi:TRAP-type C4-dicarboxylate transport system substrate-binding protein